MKHQLVVVLIGLLALATCIAPTQTPTPTVSPISPISTPQTQPVAWKSFTNGKFERPFRDLGNNQTVANGWFSLPTFRAPCVPGKGNCPFICPTSCGIPCDRADQGCWFATDEAAEAWYADYYGQRVHGDSSAQKAFIYSRQGIIRLYQVVSTVSGLTATFAVYIQAWQCRDTGHCNLEFLNTQFLPDHTPNPIYDPVRVAKLLQAWGCASVRDCRRWAISDLPAHMNIRVGIDPSGIISPTAPSVVWSPTGESFDVWSQFVVTATTTSPQATLWIESIPTFNDIVLVNNDIYVDDATFKMWPYEVRLPLIQRSIQ